ncbi:hypothetical protein BVC93_31525 (plasmid) [Mycobacterium sp. MS1601]|uniref:hypothetical protein n=1 Tax=Mycobacterium sp. MS1601 TaxID=1936029 RepID=UPI0009795E01|nr:hypothetical protein [Mycobacterium sp. MS1601]AQA07025.1 hypothetical protein BVC93_31525 [Mycobacterium sp. MS1601]
MSEQTSTTNHLVALPESVPWPIVVYTLGAEDNGVYQPTGPAQVVSSRLDVEKELATVAEPRVQIIQTTVMPWKPASPAAGDLPIEFEYTVGFGHDGQYTTWGRAISRDRAAIETDLTTVQAAVADHRAARAAGDATALRQWSLTPLLLERPILPWYPSVKA